MSWTQSLATAGAASVGLALIAILLFQAHRRFGVLPFLALFTLLATAVPATVHQTVLDAGPLGSLPAAQAIVAPLVIALVVLLHLIRGWRNAQLAAGVVLLAAVLVSVSAFLDPWFELALTAGMLAASPTLPLAAGALVCVGALVASWALLGIHKAWSRCPTLAAVVLASTAGLFVHGAGVIGLARLGVTMPGTTGFASILVPSVVGLGPMLLVGVYASVRLAGVWPETRELLLSRDPIGSESQLDEARDIQDRYAEEREAERHEADTMKQLVESAEHGAYVCTQEGRITYANKALSRILEQPDRELAGENVRHLLGGTDEQGRPRFARYPVRQGTHRATVQLPNGHERSIEVKVSPAGDGQLHGRVRDRTTEVLRARLEEQKDRAEFYVDLLRHDIGNYVMTPLNYLTVLKRRDDLPDDAQHYLKTSHAAVEDIADLLRRIDVLSELDDLHPEPVDASAILRSVGERATSKNGDALTIRYELPDGPAAVAGSPLLEEVFGNLVGNAIRHAGEDATIVLGAERDGTDWILTVADDGPGIPDADKQRIFDRSKHDESAGGKGLGLYIVQTITRALDGKVWVADRVPGEVQAGAAFKVRLPAVDPNRLEQADLGDLESRDVEDGVPAA